MGREGLSPSSLAKPLYRVGGKQVGAAKLHADKQHAFVVQEMGELKEACFGRVHIAAFGYFDVRASWHWVFPKAARYALRIAPQ